MVPSQSLGDTPAASESERIGLSTLEDISQLILQSRGLEETLRNTATLVADRMHSDVCSIYLRCDEGVASDRLVLRATLGLSQTAIGRVELAIGEGLVGYTAESRSIIACTDPQNHPRFRLIDDCNEERYRSFVGIPLYDRQRLIGVMAIQTVEPRAFSPIEISTLTTIAFQMSTVVASARLLEQLDQDSNAGAAASPTDLNSPTAKRVSLIKGDFGIGGVAMGPAYLIDDTVIVSEIGDDEPIDQTGELERLEQAFESAKIETLCLEQRVARRLGEQDAAIFHSHLMILQDRVLIEKIRNQIVDGRSATSAVRQVVGEYVAAFRRMDDPYLRERAVDIEDIGRRLLASLQGQPRDVIHLPYAAIVVATTLMPSDIARLDPQRILAFVMESSDSNSHAIIIAKSLGIPTLIGVKQVTRHVESGTPLIVDCGSRSLHIQPSKPVRKEYERLSADSFRHQAELERFKDLDAATSDGTSVTLRANVGMLSDVSIAIRYGARGVGLYRTELPFMSRSSFPDRRTQYDIYRQVVEGFPGHPVTIRSLDIGGDKVLPYFDTPAEENPFLGYRSVRVSLDHPDRFQTQIEATLMAATHGQVKLMFPMITTVEDIQACKQLVGKARSKLVAEGWQIPDVPIGMMVEVPAVIALADHLAAEVDFFALGTNDLIQYMMAADRGNASVHQYYDCLHPAMLSAVARMVDVATRHRRDLCICGEMATDPGCFALLVGLGLRDFSVSAPAMLELKSRLASWSIEDLNQLAKDAMAESRGRRIREMVDQFIETPIKDGSVKQS